MANFASNDVAAQTPYTGMPMAIPGNIKIENYDKGGKVVAFMDRDDINQGGIYMLRMETTNGSKTMRVAKQ